MHTFESTTPIELVLNIPIGDIRVVASERTDTVVDVRPSNPNRALDVKDAEETRVEFEAGVLVVKAPKRFSLFSKGGSVDVTVSLPSDSTARITAQLATVTTTGVLGECAITIAMGDIRCEQTGAAQFSTSIGDVTVTRVAGDAAVTTSSGSVRIGAVDGSATVKNSNGATWLGVVRGNTHVVSSNGDISIDEAGPAVDAKSACGNIRIGDVESGTVTLKTAAGQVEVGIRQGTAAWLDVASRVGLVTTALDHAEAPVATDRTIELHARALGNIAIRRS